MDYDAKLRAELDRLLAGCQAILFDLDGTLIAIDQAAPSRALLRIRFLEPLLSAERQERWLKALLSAAETPSNYVLAFMERLGLNTDTGFGADRFRHLKGLGTSSQSSLVPRAKQVLDWAQADHTCAVVTARSRRAATHFINEHDLTAYFAAVTTRQDTWLLKPNPAPVRHTAKLLGVPSHACLMIGDTPMDMLAAKRAGSMALGVLSGLGTHAELEKAGADLILPEIGDLLLLLSDFQTN